MEQNMSTIVERLLEAAECGDNPTLEECLQAGAPLEATDSRGATPLHKAAINGHAHTLTLIALSGDDSPSAIRELLNAADHHGWTALHDAARFGHSDAVKTLLTFGASVDAVGGGGSRSGVPPPPQTATAAGCGGGGDVSRGQSGSTALHLAVENNHLGVLQLLIERKADVNRIDSRTRASALFYALRNAADLQRSSVEAASAPIRLLLDAGATVDCKLLFQADRLGLCPELREVLAVAAGHNQSNQGTTELLVASGGEQTNLRQDQIQPTSSCGQGDRHQEPAVHPSEDKKTRLKDCTPQEAGVRIRKSDASRTAKPVVSTKKSAMADRVTEITRLRGEIQYLQGALEEAKKVAQNIKIRDRVRAKEVSRMASDLKWEKMEFKREVRGNDAKIQAQVEKEKEKFLEAERAAKKAVEEEQIKSVLLEQKVKESQEGQDKLRSEMIRIKKSAEKKSSSQKHQVLQAERRAREAEKVVPPKCCICHEQDAKILVAPCGHLCLCDGDCKSRLQAQIRQNCPVCRKECRAMVEVFFA